MKLNIPYKVGTGEGIRWEGAVTELKFKAENSK
jgi:hypothetical protein